MFLVRHKTTPSNRQHKHTHAHINYEIIERGSIYDSVCVSSYYTAVAAAATDHTPIMCHQSQVVAPPAGDLPATKAAAAAAQTWRTRARPRRRDDSDRTL